MTISLAERIKGLSHDDFFVRSAVLQHFSESIEASAEMAAEILSVIDKYGWDEAYEWTQLVANFPLTESMMPWLIAHWRKPEQKVGRIDASIHLLEWFSSAPIELVKNHHDDVLKSWGECSDRAAGSLLRIGKRVEYSEHSAEKCLELMDELLERCVMRSDFPQKEIAQLRWLGERLATCADNAAELAEKWLDVDVADDLVESESKEVLRLAVALEMAKRLRQVALVPTLIRLFDLNWDWINELIPKAICGMRDRGAVAKVIEMHAELSSAAKLYLGGVFKNGRFEGLETEIAAILENDSDHDFWSEVQTDGGYALACYGTEAGIQAARRIYDQAPDDPERQAIMELLYAWKMIGGEDDADAKRWRKQLEADFNRSKKLFGEEILNPNILEFPTTQNVEKVVDKKPMQPREPKPQLGRPKVSTPNIGRNDPCVCGSGKKYKKCCG